MIVIIDRFEGDFAVCEKDDKKMINIEKDKMPFGAKEGDVLNIEGSFIIINKTATAKRKDEIENLTKDLWS
jgi:hypothetical protein